MQGMEPALGTAIVESPQHQAWWNRIQPGQLVRIDGILKPGVVGNTWPAGCWVLFDGVEAYRPRLKWCYWSTMHWVDDLWMVVIGAGA